MKTSRKYGIYFVGFLMNVLLLTGCGQEKRVETEPFHEEEICRLSEIQEMTTGANCELIAEAEKNGNIYLLLDACEEENKNFHFCQVRDGEVSYTFSVPAGEDDEARAFDVDSNGNYYLIEERYGEEDRSIYLNRIDGLNRKNQEISLKDWIGEYDMVQNMQLDQEDTIYLFFQSGKISAFSADLEWQYDIVEHEEEYILDAECLANGNVIFASAKYEGDKEILTLYQIDGQEQCTREIRQLEDESYSVHFLMNGDGEYDYFVRGDNEISGCRLEEKQMNPVMRWENTDFVPDEIDKIYPLSEETWFAVEQKENPMLVYMKKGQAEDKKNKEILHMACLEADSEVQKEVADFNKENKDYQIEITSYSEGGNPRQEFLMALSTGADIDIILMPHEDADLIIQKNMVVDLYPFMETDLGIKKEDFFENLLQAYEQDGKLYQSVSWVHLSGWVTKKSNLEKMDGWNTDSFQALVEAYPEAAVFTDASSKNVLKELLQVTAADLVDWKKKQCYFDSYSFLQMLELAKQYGIEERNVEQKDEIQSLKDNKLLFSRTLITPVNTLLYDSALSGDFVVVASPVQEGIGAGIYSDTLQFGIASRSSKQEAAWQFVRRFFTKTYQDISKEILLMDIDCKGIPIRKDCFDDLMKRYTTTVGYEEDGMWFEPYEADIGTGIYDFISSPMTQEQEKIFRDIVAGASKKEGLDKKIEEIVLEDADSYFSGQKTKEEVAEIIQNRVSTYLME